MGLDKENNKSEKQGLSNRMKQVSKEVSNDMLQAFLGSGKMNILVLKYILRIMRIIFLNFIRFLISTAVGGAAYYAIFPSKVYQTKRTDRLFELGKEDDLIKKQGMIDYSINDDVSTFLIDMLAGMGNDDDWKQYVSELGYDICDMDSFPEDFENRALYIALRETHKLCFSPKFRIEPRDGDFKHFSNGKDAYTDHRSHTLYSYFLLQKGITPKKNPSLATHLDSKNYQHDWEKLQAVFLYHFLSELSHTYGLGIYKYEYQDRFLEDVIPGVEIVQDSFPYKIVLNKQKKDTIIHYTEYEDEKVLMIRRLLQTDTIHRDTVFKDDLTHIRHDLYRNTNKYNKSYRDGFEDWIHEGPVETTLERYFMKTYEKQLNKKSNREMYDYARILLGNLGYMHNIDQKRGKEIMFMLAEKGYEPAIRYSKRRTEPPIVLITPKMHQTEGRKRELVSYWEIQICHSKGNIIHCLETYDEKREFNNKR